MRIYYISSFPKFDDEETFMFYSSKGMIVIRSKSHIARVNEIFKIDDSNIDQYAISRGFDKVLEVVNDGEYDDSKTIWEENFSSGYWKNKVHNTVNITKGELFKKVRYRIIVDNTINSCISELAEIDYE